MSRRRAAPKRDILPDPKFGSELVARFINLVMVSGKKSISEKIVYGALFEAMDKLKSRAKEMVEAEDKDDENKIALKIFNKALDSVRPTVEVKSRRVGGSTYQVPIEVPPRRQVTLAMRWLVEAAKKRNEKTMALRLAGEIVDAFSGRGTAVKKREDTHKMAKANQAFAHYVW